MSESMRSTVILEVDGENETSVQFTCHANPDGQGSVTIRTSGVDRPYCHLSMKEAQRLLETFLSVMARVQRA